ncbi:conserved hypothetical protein [Ricinus communis]|uniref:Uncharacterized protein n=1 Tax=Ricinus communis TaxID=3988 RepID=B9T7W8_RICCO|nr:conserved hypothetical protein [Ricinus communis]
MYGNVEFHLGWVSFKYYAKEAIVELINKNQGLMGKAGKVNENEEEAGNDEVGDVDGSKITDEDQKHLKVRRNIKWVRVYGVESFDDDNEATSGWRKVILARERKKAKAKDAQLNKNNVVAKAIEINNEKVNGNTIKVNKGQTTTLILEDDNEKDKSGYNTSYASSYDFVLTPMSSDEVVGMDIRTRQGYSENFSDSENVFMRMPSETRVKTISGARAAAAAASSTSVQPPPPIACISITCRSINPLKEKTNS